MDINWTTFLFEIVNFLILVWIMWRFLYRPVRAILDRRRETIAEEMQKADATRTEAEAIRESYESRLTEWQAEKSAAQRKLDEEIGREREARLEALNTEIEERAGAARLLEERRLADLREAAEKRAAAHGARLAARLLGLSATPDLQCRLLEMVVNDLASRTGPGNGAATGDGPHEAKVVSAYDIGAQDRTALEAALTARFGETLSVRYDRDPELIAGVHISVGALEWSANLRDELRHFADAGHGEG